MRILLVEPDSKISESIQTTLKSEGFNIYTTDLGDEAIDLGKLYEYEIIVLELNLPEMSGYEVIRALRLAKINTPIMILSELTEVENKVRGFNFGADDYMTKPFHKDELIARIRAIVRRSKGHAQPIITCGELMINLDTKSVEVSGNRVSLTNKEYQTLELLALNKGKSLRVEKFLDHIYGGINEPNLNNIYVFIHRIRKKLYASDVKKYIKTIVGPSFILIDPSTVPTR